MNKCKRAAKCIDVVSETWFLKLQCSYVCGLLEFVIKYHSRYTVITLNYLKRREQ